MKINSILKQICKMKKWRKNKIITLYVQPDKYKENIVLKKHVNLGCL